MYIQFVCFFFFKKKEFPKKISGIHQLATCIFYTRGILFDTCNLYTRPDGSVYKYTRPYVSTPHLATWCETHAAKWPRVYSNGYCRHAAIYLVFCSAPPPPLWGVVSTNNVCQVVEVAASFPSLLLFLFFFKKKK
jgi:hypothetical protein